MESIESTYRQVAVRSRRDQLILEHLSLVRHVVGRLLAELPPGLDVLEVVVAGPGSLAERLEASEWRIALPGGDPEAAGAAVEAVLA